MSALCDQKYVTNCFFAEENSCSTCQDSWLCLTQYPLCPLPAGYSSRKFILDVSILRHQHERLYCQISHMHGVCSEIKVESVDIIFCRETLHSSLGVGHTKTVCCRVHALSSGLSAQKIMSILEGKILVTPAYGLANYLPERSDRFRLLEIRRVTECQVLRHAVSWSVRLSVPSKVISWGASGVECHD